jgi:hypothetical protein
LGKIVCDDFAGHRLRYIGFVAAGKGRGFCRLRG